MGLFVVFYQNLIMNSEIRSTANLARKGINQNTNFEDLLKNSLLSSLSRLE